MVQGWIAAGAYTLQIYFDFSGYCDMAIGGALMMGIVLPINFNAPYKSRSIIEFWRRWHMTLSRFLRDYLYIPLGGNRKGPGRRYLNLLVTMFLGGLWHGAGWTFIAWGSLHGLYLAINHLWRDLRRRSTRRLPGTADRLLSTAATLVLVMIAWVFFRAPTMKAAVNVLTGMTGLNGRGVADKTTMAILIAIFCLVWTAPTSQKWLASHYVRRGQSRSRDDQGDEALYPLPPDDRAGWHWRPTAWQGVVIGILAFFAVKAATNTASTPFLYFNF